MIVKKKIIQQPYDLEAEKLYYKEAATCPNCGTSRETPYNAPFELPPIDKLEVPYSPVLCIYVANVGADG